MCLPITPAAEEMNTGSAGIQIITANPVDIEKDYVEYYNVDRKNSVIEFDSSRGPYYQIDYLNKTILDCTSEGAVIKDLVINGDSLSITLFSDERPEDTTYVFDLTKNNYSNESYDVGEDVVEYYYADRPNSVIEFDSSRGPYYRIDYLNKTILGCTSDGAVIKDLVLNGDILNITLFSNERPEDTAYEFDLSAAPAMPTNPTDTDDPFSSEDFIEYCRISTADNMLEFYSADGPFYRIDYANENILECASTGAVIKNCTRNGDVLTLVLYCDELPEDRTYTFELRDTEYRAGAVTPESCNEPDAAKHYKVFPAASRLEFDTSKGPYYCIDYKEKSIVSCTSGGAVMKECDVNGDVLTVVLYSDERPADTTYVFDLTKFNYSDGSHESSGDPYDAGEDVVEYYNVDSSKSVIQFDSSRGPRYQIDYQNKVILDCTSEGAVIKDLMLNGDILSITLFSEEWPKDTTYEFNLKAASSDSTDSTVSPTPTVTPTPEVTPTPTVTPTPEVTPTPAVKPSENNSLPSTKEQEAAILKQKNENDPKGAAFLILQAKQGKVTDSTITLTWKKVKGAGSYTVYAARTGNQNSFKKIKTVKENVFVHKKLKKATFYKYIVVANGNGKALATSPILFIATSGGKTGNPAGVTLKKTNISVKLKKTAKIEAGIKKGKQNVKEFRPLGYESNNTDVATVDKNGKIKGISKGTCYICIFAQNGDSQKLKVTVN